MKLLFCIECKDVVKLQRGGRKCQCGKSEGWYLNDGLNARHSGPAVLIGIANSDIQEAIAREAMSEMTPEKLRDTLHQYAIGGLAYDADMDALADAAFSAWEADRAMRADGLCLVHGLYSVDEDNPEGDCKACRIQSRIEALWKRCRIVYFPPVTEATGWAQPYPIEHNMAAGKNGREAIEAILAAEEET